MKNNKHLYFKLSAFEKELQSLITANKYKWRKNAVGEAQKFLDMGLLDRAATRQLDWGVEVPVEGYEDKRIYVWIEAVYGYLTTAKHVAESRGIDFDKFMSNDNPNLRTYYVHGKDNIPFHTTIFPALELGLKYNYRLPDYIVSSAYVNLNDEKMSKSKGNLISVNELLETFNSETARFYFIFNGPETKDTNCSLDDMVLTHNKFLVGMLGNFVNRNLSFILKKFEGKITEGKIDDKIKEATLNAYNNIGDLIEKAELKSALTEIMEYVSLGNKYYDERQPWIQVKENIDDFNDTTYTCVYMMANISRLIAPFLPKTTQKINNILNLKDIEWKEYELSGDITITESPLLFERIETK